MQISIELIAAVITVAGSLGATIGILLRHERRHARLEVKIEAIEKQIDELKPLKDTINAIIAMTQTPSLINLVKQVSPSEEKRNPYDPAEKNALLKKYQDGTITVNEAKRLQEILNEDLSLVERDDAAAIAIVLLLIGLAAFIAILLSSAKPAAAV